MDYSKMVQIDPYNLDHEWQVHPDYIFRCGEALANARRDLDEAKEAYDLEVAEVDRDIRESAEKKPVEREIENMITRAPSVQEAKQRLIDAKYNVSMLEAARAGLEARGAALANLVKLHGMTYYAEPSADIETRGRLEDIRQESLRARVKIGKGGSSHDDKPAEMTRRNKSKE